MPQEKEVIIRPFGSGSDTDDLKLARFHVSKANMEPLAKANVKALWHPISASIWIACAAFMISILSWWPDGSVSVLGYLRPLPAFAACLLPVLFFIDWYQREDFVRISEDKLKLPDMQLLQEYYARSSASGFYICEFGQTFTGLISVDASLPSADWQPGKVYTRAPRAKDISSTAIIRHFYVVEKYRAASIQDDLLSHATRTAFEQSNVVERIEVRPPALSTYVDNALLKQGFTVKETVGTIGIFKWPQLVYELKRENWEGQKM